MNDTEALAAAGSREREVAVSLMRMALALLDRSGDASFGAARLQHAIDTVLAGVRELDLNPPR